jgi:hypothetical protein
VNENLEIIVDTEGVWLVFKASNGKIATLSVTAIANSVHGPMTEAALFQWIRDRKKERGF